MGRFQDLETAIKSGEDVQIPSEVKDWLSKKKFLYINGKWVEGSGKKTFATVHPGDGGKLAEVCVAERADVDLAVLSAKEAVKKGEWRKLALKDRAKVLRRLSDLILEHKSVLALLESLDTGKPIRESFDGDIPRAALNLQFFSSFAENADVLKFENPQEWHMAVREPIGVAALITPWNLPLYLETWKLAPALIMGNSVVLKPSELTPLTACYLAELIEQVGLPPGVFNLVNGFGENSTGEFLTGHSGVDAISFTGETGTGRAIMRSASVGPTRVSFELGGKGASIVFKDCNFESAMNECLRAAFRNQGEICLACPRIFVEEAIFDKFVDEFKSKASQIKVGNPLNYQTQMGALISDEHLHKVMGYIDKVSPGKILTGGIKPSGVSEGYFLAPTVITGLPLEHPISREEVFGPVVSIYPFKTEDEVVEAVNSTPYGLSASLWTRDDKRVERLTAKIQTGLLWVNCWFVRDLRVPFGGQKRSGVGREGGKFSLDFFSEWKSICYRKDST